jgi:hypothetical protein
VQKVLWHELIHLYFRNHKLFPLLKKKYEQNLEAIAKIDELIASALLPNGLLGKDSLTSPDELATKTTANSFNSRLAKNEVLNVQKLIYPYLQSEKTLDEKLVQDLIDLT